MARTYVKGRTTKLKNKGFKRRTPTHHGHCWICGYDPRLKGQKKTQQRSDFKFDVIPFIDWVLKMKKCKDCGEEIDTFGYDVRCPKCKKKNTLKRKYQRRHEYRKERIFKVET
jgi:hypothetical protein